MKKFIEFISESNKIIFTKGEFEDCFLDILDLGWELKFDSEKFSDKNGDEYRFYKINIFRPSGKFDAAIGIKVLLDISSEYKLIHDSIAKCKKLMKLYNTSLYSLLSSYHLASNQLVIVFIDKIPSMYSGASDLFNNNNHIKKWVESKI